MKSYKAYMNKISVTDRLHRKIVVRAEGAADIIDPAWPTAVSRPAAIRRYAAICACCVLIGLSVFTVSQLWPSSTPLPGNDSALIFNQAQEQSAAADAAVAGLFWQELNADELEAVFPGLTGTHRLTATVNFKSEKNSVAFYNIDAFARSAAGLKTYIKIAPGMAGTDYVLGKASKQSDVLGTPVMAGVFETKPNSRGLRNVIYFANFQLSGLGYYVELGGTEAEKEALQKEFTTLITRLIEGGAADISVFHPVVPQLRHDLLNLLEARADTDFGAYLPAQAPGGFVFGEALRIINQEQDTLIVFWRKGMNYIDWHVSRLEEKDKARITSVADRRNYDLSFYPIPHADSVPADLREIVDNPIFRSEELTLDAVKARTYKVDDAGDEPGPRMRFSVLYDDILIEVDVKGLSPEAVYQALQEIKHQ
jgi:hypothetical protein